MSLPTGFNLATDAAFRLVAGFTEPPKAGRILAIEGNGQARIELDEADGGEVLAWPLNGFVYAPGDVIYVLFAANAPESGIILGSLAPLPALPGQVIQDHGELPGLDDDDHTSYARLVGRSGGQALTGGTDSGDDLLLESTSHTSKGRVVSQSPLIMQRSGAGATVVTNRVDGNAGAFFSGPSQTRLLFTDDGTLRIAAYANAYRQEILDGSLQAANVTDLAEIGSHGRMVIGGTAPAASAALEVRSTTGGLLLPRLTTTQRDALSTPVNGLLIYNTTTGKIQARAGGSWVDLH